MTKTLSVKGQTFAYRDEGKGPPLLFITGLSGTMAYWDSLWDWFSQRFRLLAFDHPGVGASAAWQEACTIESLAEGVIDWLDALEIERLSVVGHSMGGAIAQVLAIDHPSRVDRLVLSATWSAADEYFRQAFDLRKRLLDLGDLRLYFQAQALLAYPPAWIAAQGAIWSEQFALLAGGAPPLPLMKARIEALTQFDRQSDLASIAAPTLVVGARDDLVVPPHLWQPLKEKIPGAQAITLESGGHFPSIVNATAYREAIAPFLLES